MSIFSGKCDLYDHISGCAGWYDKDGNSVKFEDENVHVLYSDEYRDFLEFKKKTGGVLHQHQKVKVTEWNQDEVVKQLKGQFEIIKHENVTEDKRYKDKQRNKIIYTYKYWGKEYTSLKELNKHGVWVTIDIYFHSILDIIPYYPYIVTTACCNEGKETIFISKESFVISERDDYYSYGHFSDSWQWYNKKLQNHYFEICRDYLCYKLEERTKVIPLDLSKMECPEEPGTGDYMLRVEDEIDFNHNIEFIWEDEKCHTHWTSPKQSGDHDIIISHQDIENYLKEDIKKGTVKIKYVAVPEGGFPLHVG